MSKKVNISVLHYITYKEGINISVYLIKSLE